MHEVGLIQSAVELAVAEASRQGASRIHVITLRIGALVGVVPEAMEFAFDVVTRGTPAEGSRLEVQHVAVVCLCESCGCEFRPASVIFECPTCHQLSARLQSGRELELASLEVS